MDYNAWKGIHRIQRKDLSAWNTRQRQNEYNRIHKQQSIEYNALNTIYVIQFIIYNHRIQIIKYA